MSDTPLTVEFKRSAIRRGHVPTPDGALPNRRRTRQGMVNLQEWDARVQADNKAKGTSSNSDSPTFAELLEANATPAETKAIAPAANPGQPDLPPSPPKPGLPEVSRGAISEDLQIGDTIPPVVLPKPDPAAVEAAKAELASQGLAGLADDTVPPPPSRKAAKPKTK